MQGSSDGIEISISSCDASPPNDNLVISRPKHWVMLPGNIRLLPCGEDSIVVSNDTVDINQSRGCFNIAALSNWQNMSLDMAKTAYLCISTDRCSAKGLILQCLFLGALGAYGVMQGSVVLEALALLGLLVTNICFAAVSEDSVLFATKKTELDGCDGDYEGSEREAVEQKYLSSIYRNFLGTPPPAVGAAPEVKFEKNILAYRALPKGKDTIEVHRGHMKVEKKSQWYG
jgi:hypothetical protein